MSGQPGWLKIALGAGVGFLCGVLLIVVLAVGGSDGGDRSTTARARTATVERVAVPDVVGLRLDVARERLEDDGFAVQRHGGGLLGIVVESNWEVQGQTPTAGTGLARGATVELHVERP